MSLVFAVEEGTSWRLRASVGGNANHEKERLSSSTPYPHYCFQQFTGHVLRVEMVVRTVYGVCYAYNTAENQANDIQIMLAV